MSFNPNDIPEEGAVPNGPYTIHVMDIADRISGDGATNYLNLDCEILSPDTVPLGNVRMKTAGRKFNLSLFLTEKSQARLIAVLKKLGLYTGAVAQPCDSFDVWKELVKAQLLTLKGKKFMCLLESEENTVKQSLTPEEIATGKKRYDAAELIDPATGKPYSKGWIVNAKDSGILPGIPMAVGGF